MVDVLRSMPEKGVRFQLAHTSDAKTLAQLRKQIRLETYRGIYPDETLDQYDFLKNIENFSTQITEGHQQLWLIMKGEEAIGYFGVGEPIYWYPDHTDRNELFLNSMYLCKQYWRKGIGKAAMKFIMQLAKSQGKKMLYNNCNMHNRNAVAFYRACGGVEIYSEGGHENPAEDQMTFEYKIE